MRQEFSAKSQRIIWNRAKGECEGLVANGEGELIRCRAPCDHGCFHYDHIDPEWISHRNDPDNGQLLCTPCHKAKTRIDVSNIAKVKRIHDRQKQIKRSKSRMPYGKDSPLKRKVNGEVVPRWE